MKFDKHHVIYSVLFVTLILLYLAYKLCWIPDLVCWVAGGLTVLAIIAVQCHVASRYREYVHRPLTDGQISSNLKAAIQTYESSLLEMGFQPIGTWQLLEAPLTLSVRAYLAADQSCFALVEDHAEQQRVLAFNSLTEDGFLFETGNIKLDFQPLDNSSLILAGFPNLDPDQLLAAHKSQIQSHQVNIKSPLCQLEPEDIRMVLDYAHKLSGADLHAQGKKKTGPTELVGA